MGLPGLGIKRWSVGGGASPGSRSLLLAELHLSQPDVLRGDLGALVLPDELEGLLEAQLSGWNQPHELIRSRAPHVRELLLFRRIHVHVLGARVLADDH